jgi:hypothetical protein
MSQDEKKERTSPEVVAAMSRLAGAHAAAIGLAVTYVAAVVGGASAPTALLRAGVAGLTFLILGRFAGNFIARHLVPGPTRGSASRTEPAEAHA